MSHDDKSLGDENTFDGGANPDRDAKSLGDEPTFAGGSGRSAPQSIGDGKALGSGVRVDEFGSRYAVESVLGKGGMGEVLLATDTRLNRKVAIK